MEAVYSKIKDMLKAFYPVLYLTSFEYDRTKQKIEGIINVLRTEGKDVRIFNWNCVDGLRGLNGDKPQPVINKDGEEIVEPEEVLKYILNDKDASKDVFVLEDFNNYIEEENVKYYIRSIAERARHTNTHAIILSAVYKLPVELEKYVTVLNIPLPNRLLPNRLDMEKTLGVVERQCKINLSVEMRNRMVDAALGMTSMEADLAFCLAAVKDDLGQNAPYTVSSEKEQIIKKSGILDYFPKNESLKDVGGMEVLKDWLFKRQKAYEKKARDFGLQEPKGLLLLGVPGCGKSLTAKSIASFWNMPLLRLDIGKVYQGLVGSSEDNINQVPEGMVQVQVRLSARYHGVTRATGDWLDPTDPKELIHDYWVAFVNTSNIVEELVSGNCGTAGKEEDTFKKDEFVHAYLSLARGPYQYKRKL